MTVDYAALDRRLPRTRWKYQGRHIIEGVERHVWHRRLPQRDHQTGYEKLGIAISVSDFWPN